MTTAYLLDTNVFIQAKNLYYGFDVCPGFWQWLQRENAAGKVFSIGRVYRELRAGEDSLSDWARVRGRPFFLEPDARTVRALARVSEHVVAQAYEPAAVSTFLESADYYLIGQAMARGDTVITHEKAGGGSRRVKIPDVCIGLDVPHASPFEMLRAERASFVLAPLAAEH